MPSFGDFGDAQIEVYGEWISDTLQSSLTRIPSGTEDRWGFLEWEEENTDDETEAYIRIDILKASDSSVLASDLSSNITVPFKKGKIDLTNYSSVGTNDIKLKVKLYSITKEPIIRRLRQNIKWSW